MFADGDTNLFGYVSNNPVNFTDPEGLYAEVIVWEPVGYGKSAFGHVSVNMNGTSYSFGPNGMDVSPINDYLKRNDFRGGTGAVLNLTTEQEAVVESQLKNPGDYGRLSNNCVNPVQEGLNAAGVNVGSNLLPVSLAVSIFNSGAVNSYNSYSPKPPK